MFLLEAAVIVQMRLASAVSACLVAGGVHVEHGWLKQQSLQRARTEAAWLLDHSGSTTGTVGRAGVDTSARRCDVVDLLSDEVWSTLPETLVDITLRLDELRKELHSATTRPLLPSVELQLLRYPAGGHYARHVDDGVGTARSAVRRSISFVLYLTPSDWAAQDGGELLVHGKSSIRILPTAGSLVLFDSAMTPHEVLRTSRERMACVGWYLCQRGQESASQG